MTDLELIQHLAALGVKLWVEGDALRFSAPRGVLDGALRDRLRARKDALRSFLQRAGRPSDGDATIPSVPRDGPLPLSFGQERLWFLHQLDPADPSYVVPLVARFEGALDHGALARALGEIVRRHEVLRTTYALEGDRPVASIHDRADVPLPVTSFVALPEAEREPAVRREMATEMRRPFDLGAGPILRARLFEIAAEDHVLLVTMHHIASDGWTNALLGREIDALHDAFARGAPAPLPDLPLQYADYAAWQRQRLADGVLGEQLAYWKAQLEGAPRILDLPADRPRPRVASHRGGLVHLDVDATTARALDDLARREGATLFMVLLAAFHALLHRWSGQADLCVGTPVAGRAHPATEAMAGFFVNTLVIRARVDEGVTFRALVASVREACLAAYAHQDVPFERVVQEIDPARDMGRAPLFQALFSLQAAPPPAWAAASAATSGIRRRGMGLGGSTAKFDVTLAMAEGPKGLSGAMEFATDLFDRATIERMLGGFRVLLAGVVAHPDAPVWELPLLDEAERHRVVVAWNDTAFPLPEDALVHEIVAREAACAPDAVAVSFEGRDLTFGELDARAGRLAGWLRRHGVGPETIVGVCMDRSIELLVALHGVLRAGGAYLPLDPSFPADRLAFMLDDAQPPVILTQAHLARVLPERASGARILRLDADASLLAAEPAAPGDRAGLTPDSLAYVIYTSGSTGRPKGAMNTHRGVLNRLLWMQHAYALGPADRVLQKTPFSFDVSVWELFWPSMFGACLVVARPGGHRDPRYLADVFAAQGISTAHFVPSMLTVFLDEIAPPPAGNDGGTARTPACSLRNVVCSGEALSAALAARFFAALRGVALHNLYGPTEAAVDVTAGAVPPGASAVTIGRPIHNTRIYVLDAHLQPVPTGVRGELYIGGVQVGRGYLNRPELTAERFVRDSFAVPVDGAGEAPRMYRTGDVARWLASGEIEYLGRTDFQVKLRGFRIELGEIEATLQAHPAAREAVVVAREDVPGDQRLVAYLVASDPAAPPSPAELRAFTGAALPEHMVPSAFVVLPALPLTSNGKVDRRALPAPDAAALVARAFVAPRGPVEDAIAAAFAEVLKLPSGRVGAHDGFFDLGGHSLLATLAIARVQAALGVALPLRALFEAPTPAGLAACVAGAGADPAASPPITRAPPGAPPVLSFGQERLWFLDQLEPGDPSYVVPLAVRLGGALDTGALERALAEILRRHEVLRTTYDARDGGAAPVLHPPAIALPVQSLRALATEDCEAALRRALASEARRLFDLAAGPVIRAQLFELADADHVLAVSIHHIACDAWSMEILAREIGALYGAFAGGMPSPLPDLPLQYADYAAWQRAWLSGDTLDRQLAYWRAQLAGAPGEIDLALDHPRPPAPSHRGAVVALPLPPAIGAALARLAGDLSATLFMVLLAAFDVLLHRYSGQDDLVVGAPIAGRTRTETEGLVGFFVNSLALRADLSGDPTFADLVARVKEACLGAYAHQDLPFERLVQALVPDRDPGRTPLFQVALVLQNVGGGEVALPGLRHRGLGAESVTAKFDLTLALREGPRGLAGSIEYATDVFDRTTIERMAGHYAALLGAIAGSPSRKLWDLPLLDDEERRRVITEWNATRTPYPREATIHALFAAQAEATPEATAIVLGGERLTYRALDLQANQLAHHLRALGVGHEAPVGLYARRSREMVVATLAILKAGGAYLPLDPEMPDARLAFMLEDAGATVVVAAGVAGGRLGGVAVVDLVADAGAIAAAPSEAPEPVGSGESLAYVMYTSGSTGTPKGVCVVHRGVVRLVRDTGYARFGADEAFLQLAPIAFDAATLEIWGPLLNGGRLVIFPAELPTAARLGEVIAASGVTTLWLTAGLFNAVMDERPEALAPLRQLLVGGEALSVPHVQKALGALPGVQLINGYGPTEGTTFTCCHPITSVEGVTSVPIGRPIANSVVYVLDDHRQPVPVGVPGELYVGGDGLARGYLRRPELDAARFVPDPFSEDVSGDGARLYRTGDRVRWLPDGTLAFLGRLDQQVKLRGFRIELGEIEAVLGAHPGVGACAVILREDAPGDRRLCAYVVGAGAKPAPAALRAWIEERLPAYMVPSAFVALAALPLTANGKVDRRALPAPEGDAYDGTAYVAPRGPIEETLAGIFAEVLRVPPDRVGAHADFFALGGHSLLATQAVGRLRAALGVELPLRALFEAPTVADLAARAAAALQAGQGTLAPPLVPVPRDGPGPLSFAQERLWFLHQLDPADPSYVVPLATRFEGSLDVAALARALRAIVHRHEVLRTTFPLRDGQPVALVHPDDALDLPVTPLADLPDADRLPALRRALADEAARPFDLAAGPVIRARLFALGPQDHVLCLAMHHIVSDGWTVGVLDREIGALYEAFAAGLASPLPDLPIQYADYAAWQRAWLAGDVLDGQLAYWTARLQGAPRALDLPTDRPRPPAPSHRGDQRFFTLPERPTRALRDLARREGATLFMVLCAAFDVLLYRCSGQTDLVVGTPIANRTRAEIEGLAGFFVNTLVLRVQLDPEGTFVDLLRQVREVALGAYAHQDAPFERLVQVVEPVRDLSRSPLFQVMFALQNVPAGGTALAGTRRRGVRAGGGTAKFDLNFTLADGPNGLSGAMDFATDLFDPDSVERLLAAFRALLEALPEGASRRLWELPLQPPDEARRLLAAWNDTAFPHPEGDACLHAIFERRVDLTPDAVAVSFAGSAVTYGELDARANRVACALRRRGVGPDQLVGVCMDRAIEMLTALYGVLKAGGAYVPLDPEYPRDRLAFMLADARPAVILTQAHLAAALPGSEAAVIRIDAEAEILAGEPPDRLPRGALGPDHLAYVIYTSGSTGRPKGAMNAHRGVVNRLAWMQRAFGIGPGDVVVQKTPFSFDVSVWELFWPLLQGARLVVARPDGHRDPAYLRDLVAAEGVTTMHFVPSMLRAFLDQPGLDRCRALRLVFASGEALPPALAEGFFRAFGGRGVGLHNLYGPTEAAVDVTHWACAPGDAVVPIGWPIDNVRVHVLDPHLQPVPAGVRGEIYLGGVQVGRGYLGRPDLTAERFLPDPFDAAPGARMYWTGDLGRRRADGAIAYLGRTDFQVKVRGFRIELGEIEAALEAHPAVREAVVLARGARGGGDNLRLVAYVVGEGAASPHAVLRDFLRLRLPDHMLPAAYVPLDVLPLTASGKIDRRALHEAEPEAGAAAERPYVAPRGPVEEALAGIFAEVLHVARVGAHDGFFALGGHSLLAAQAAGRIRAALGVDLPLRALFEAPTPADLAARVSALLGDGAPPDPAALAPIPRVDRAAPLEPSFGQERLWVLHQLAPEDPSYVVPLSLRLAGPLDAPALARALHAIVRRHEVLRTTFDASGGRPVPRVHDTVDLPLPLEDLRALPPADRAARAREAAAAEAALPFDLACGPVLRARLYVLADDEALLLLSLHHVVADAWSTAVLSRELFALYAAFREGRPSPLADLPIQYADFAAWQRRALTGDRAARGLVYWQDALAGATHAIDLPFDRPRPLVASHRGANRPFALSPALSRALDDLARREGATLFMTLLAAFDVLLHRHTDQDDFTVGTPIANRDRAELEGLVGFFLNTLVLRARVDPAASFRALLARVRETCLGAYAHQDMPFERLVQALDPERDLGRSPLFQVLFTLQDSVPRRGSDPLPDSRGPEGRGWEVSSVAAAKFDLSLGMGRSARGITGGFDYATDLFDAATIDRLVTRFTLLLEGIASDPEAPLWALPLLPDTERARVLHAWNDTAFAYPDDATFPAIIARRAALTPDAVALSFEGHDLGYDALARRSNRLAHRLRRHGVGPEVLVGVCMERSLDMLVALHGVLAAGGAYVPLDPSYPADRLAFMLDDARPAVILTQAHLAGVLRAHADAAGIPVLCLDAEAALLVAEPDAPLDAGVTLESLAYVIYTSGSTGRPKGAMNTHRGVRNRLLWGQHAHPLGAADRVLQKTPFSFDVSVWELFWSSLAGARLVISRPGGHREPGYLADTLVAQGVTTVHFVPSMLALFLDELDRRPDVARALARALHRVVCSGEALPAALAARFFALVPGVPLLNFYGPTETAVEVTACEVLPGAAAVTIGRPIHNTRVYVLDAHLHPVPIGVCGELYIAGVQVGRGYLNRPELTAERFLDNPFGPPDPALPPPRMYRTGDVARWLPSGEVAYVGRADFQVKVRGFRIELGEIEATLLRLPAVREAVVVARSGAGGSVSLAAYLVADREAPAPSVGALRAFLGERLPEHMIPSAFVLLPALPLTASGKVDRRALPAPEEGERPDLGEAYVAPQGPVEEALARIWSALLRNPRIGARDDFFALGGDSILAIQIVARAQAEGLRVTPRQIFQHPTLAGLASVAEIGAAVLAEQGPVTGPVVATPIQRWWLDQRLDDPHHYNQAFFFEVEDRLDPALLDDALASLLAHHDMLRLRVAAADGAPPSLEIAPLASTASPLRRVDLGATPASDRRAAVERAAAGAQASLDLAAGPLLRAVLFDLGGAAPDRLLLVVHHLAVDGVSWRILLDDLWTAYAARRAGRPIALPPKTTSFPRWAERLAAHAASPALAAERAHWLGLARAGAGRLPRLPKDHDHGAPTEATARTLVVSLSEPDTEALLTRVPDVYRTQINDALLTALTQALAPWAASSSADPADAASTSPLTLLLDLEGHGREDLFPDLDLTRTVGWFTSLFPVVLDLDPAATPGDALKSVKEQLRAIPGRGLGYGLLRYLAADAALAAQLAVLRADIVFNYLGQLDQAVPDDAPLRPARESSGPSRSPRARRAHLLAVDASVRGGRLHAVWTYSESCHHRATVQALADRWVEALRAIIEHCLFGEAGGATPSDFGQASLSQDAIDMLAGLDPEG